MRAFWSACISIELVVLAACAPAIPRPNAADADWASARWPETSLASLAEGRTVYVENCGGCHVLYDPARAWRAREELEEMSDRAHLSRSERVQLARWLETAAR
jgi:mono/diheme cytochrome c family protein